MSQLTYSPITIKRINGEIKHFLKLKNEESNLENIFIHPNPDNILEIFFMIKGEKDSPFEGGEYLCKLVHHHQYPMKAPDYYVYTPNGRFEINRKICLTNSGFHQGDWAPAAWNLLTLLNGFYSIWHSDVKEDKIGIGHMNKPKNDILNFTKQSIEFNKTQLNEYNNYFH
jgi:ubiquitin-protein ligase